MFGYTARASGADLYNPANGQLNAPKRVIGGSTHTNVVLTRGQVVSLAGGAPSARVDTYNPALNQITIPAVTVGATTYTNVVATVASLQSIGGANWVDSYYSSTGRLRVAAVLVNSTTCNNAVITVGSIVGVNGGLPLILTTSAVPGLIEGTDTSGYIIYVGLAGSGLVLGARFVLIRESAGSLGSSGNGDPYQWDVGSQILSMH